MTIGELIKRPSAFLPIALSVLALGLIGGFVVLFGIVQQEDEGAAARLFQLIMLVQALISVSFLIRWVPSAPRPALVISLLQLAAAAVPIVVVVLLES